jgi:excinuclease ABC subunit B
LGSFDYGKGKRGITGATKPAAKAGKGAKKGAATVRADGLAAAPAEDLVGLIEQLTEQMHGAAAELQFEVAARIRDEVSELKKELRQMQSAGHA